MKTDHHERPLNAQPERDIPTTAAPRRSETIENETSDEILDSQPSIFRLLAPNCTAIKSQDHFSEIANWAPQELACLTENTATLNRIIARASSEGLLSKRELETITYLNETLAEIANYLEHVRSDAAFLGSDKGYGTYLSLHQVQLRDALKENQVQGLR